MKTYLVILVGLLFCTDIQAQRVRKGRWADSKENIQVQEMRVLPVQSEQTKQVEQPKAGEVCEDALKEVNDKRATMGLRPFIHDPLLTQAALSCAKIRAAKQIHGHLSSDFDYLPKGGVATSAGCGALEPSWGWGTCCYTENYTYAGAAWVMGSDGRRYMHIFVR